MACTPLEHAPKNNLTSSDFLTRGYPDVSDTVQQSCEAGVVAGVVYNRVVQTVPKSNAIDSTRPGANQPIHRAGTNLVGLGDAECSVSIALKNRRANSINSAEFYDNEIKVTRNLNRELANVNSHMMSCIAQNRLLYSDLEEKAQSGVLTTFSVQQAHQRASADLNWAQKQRDVARANFEGQQQVANDSSLGTINDLQAQRLRAELLSLDIHVASLEQELADLLHIIAAILQVKR